MSLRRAYVYYVFASVAVCFLAPFIILILIDLVYLVPAAVRGTLPKLWSTSIHLAVGMCVPGGSVLAVGIAIERLYKWVRLDKIAFEREVVSIPLARWMWPAAADAVVRKHQRPIRKKTGA